jgi:FecR protein
MTAEMTGEKTADLSGPDQADLRALGALARAGLDDKRDAAWLAATDMEALTGRRGRRRLALATAFTLVGAAAALALFVTRPPAPGPTRVSDVAAPPLGYTVEPATPEAPQESYLFADGTTVAAAADAAIAVDTASAARPRVRVVRGRVRVRVVHRDGRQWTFHAGPYDVRVTGTAFDLTWDAAAGRVALHMREGAVEVRGPGLDRAAPVRAGQDMQASIAGGAPAITTPAAAATGADPEVRPPASEHASRGHEATGHEATMPGRGETWRTLVGRGAFGAVLAQARERPLAACLSRCSSDELRALGDAARYSRRPALAVRALEALRRRFPATADGTAAIFLLGRTAEAQGRRRDAATWYARYLEDAPTGEFSIEAAAGRARAAGEAAR